MRVRTREHVRNEGSRRFKSAPLRQPVSTFAYIYGEGRKLARNAGVFLPQRTGESHLTPNSPDPASILSVRNKNGSLQRPGCAPENDPCQIDRAEKTDLT